MKTYQTIALLLALALSAANSFTVNSQSGSSFIISQRPRRSAASPASARTGTTGLQMGSMAKFGVFSPAVYGAKIVLGQDKLNKIRGKAISLHSQYIGEFCEWSVYMIGTGLLTSSIFPVPLMRSHHHGCWNNRIFSARNRTESYTDSLFPLFVFCIPFVGLVRTTCELS